jgi:hypothetical protein
MREDLTLNKLISSIIKQKKTEICIKNEYSPQYFTKMVKKLDKMTEKSHKIIMFSDMKVSQDQKAQHGIEDKSY